MDIKRIQRDIDYFDYDFKEGSVEAKKVDNKQAKKAYILLKTMMLNNVEDYYLYFASINLLNAYTKQGDATEEFKGRYSHKYFVTQALDSAIANNMLGVTFSHNKDGKDHVLLVNIEGTQFSFHGVIPSGKMDFAANEEKIQHKKEEWEGVKLQPFAGTLFNEATKLDYLSQGTIAGCTVENLLQEIDNEFKQEEFKQGKGKEVINDFDKSIDLL